MGRRQGCSDSLNIKLLLNLTSHESISRDATFVHPSREMHLEWFWCKLNGFTLQNRKKKNAEATFYMKVAIVQLLRSFVTQNNDNVTTTNKNRL